MPQRSPPSPVEFECSCTGLVEQSKLFSTLPTHSNLAMKAFLASEWWFGEALDIRSNWNAIRQFADRLSEAQLLGVEIWILAQFMINAEDNDFDGYDLTPEGLRKAANCCIRCNTENGALAAINYSSTIIAYDLGYTDSYDPGRVLALASSFLPYTNKQLLAIEVWMFAEAYNEWFGESGSADWFMQHAYEYWRRVGKAELWGELVYITCLLLQSSLNESQPG